MFLEAFLVLVLLKYLICDTGENKWIVRMNIVNENGDMNNLDLLSEHCLYLLISKDNAVRLERDSDICVLSG